MKLKKIVTIVGARPQIIKSSAISRAVQTDFSDRLVEVIVHTGQHYAENMSRIFFDEMKIPEPDYNLQVGSSSHATQTARMLEGLEEVFIKEKPDAVIVYGDTNSTLAGALAAAKIHIPVVHVEAGLRSFNKSMPEEINRISCDHMSTLLFTPTRTGRENLRKEGFQKNGTQRATIDRPKVFHCGDVMYDNTLHFAAVAHEYSTILGELKLENKEFVLMTVHRDTNTDIPERLEDIFRAVLDLSRETNLTFVIPLHPRTTGKLESIDKDLYEAIQKEDRIKMIPPVGFMDIISLEKAARMIMTDSGGLQKESYFFEKPCVILRDQTEWIEIVENGNGLLAGADYSSIKSAFNSLYKQDNFTFPPFYGDGRAAHFICETILNEL